MEFVKITSKCGLELNAEVRCEHCGKSEVVYGRDTAEWFQSVSDIKCQECGKGGRSNESLHKKSVKAQKD